MGMQCAICHKKPVTGNQYVRRGKAKYLGGVGRKVTGISRRTFSPNLQRIQIEIDGNVQRKREENRRKLAETEKRDAGA